MKPSATQNLTIIVAFDNEHGIGINNTLPWRLSEDLVRFKRITSGNVVIMGRKTYDSIGKPLPNRRNIVLTRQTDWQADGVEIAHDLDEALRLAHGQNAFVIGGAILYQQALPICSTLLITEIQATRHCDAFFPRITEDDWLETERETHFSELNQFNYAFVTYQRKENSIRD